MVIFAAKEKIVCIKTLTRRLARMGQPRRLNSSCECGDQCRCYLVLKNKNVLQFAIIAMAPDVRSRYSVKQLNVYPHATARPLNAAAYQVLRPQFVGNGLLRHLTIPVSERGAPRDYYKRVETGQRSNQVFGNTVHKVGVLLAG